jgi:hypothetical protein
VKIGGSLRVDVTIDSECSDDNKNEIRDQIHHKLQSLAKGSCGIVNTEFDISIVFNGGRPPSIKKLQDLTPEIFSSWEKSVIAHPVELEHTIKLTPYYDLLVDNEKKKAFFKKAVNMYFMSYGTKHSVRRNAEALKEEKTVLMFANAWFSQNKWKLVVVAATGCLAAAATAAAAPTAAAAVAGAILAKTLL